MKTKKDSSTAPVETVYCVKRISQGEYSLVMLSIQGDTVTDQKVLHSDIPAIVVGKLLQKIREASNG